MTSNRSLFETYPRFATDKWGRISNFIVSLSSILVASNPRRGRKDGEVFFDELLYEQRCSIERTNAWMDHTETYLIGLTLNRPVG